MKTESGRKLSINCLLLLFGKNEDSSFPLKNTKINSNHLSLSDDTTLLDEISVSTRETLTFSWITVEIGNIVKNIVFLVFNLIREIRCRYQPALIESIDSCCCREATLKRENFFLMFSCSSHSLDEPESCRSDRSAHHNIIYGVWKCWGEIINPKGEWTQNRLWLSDAVIQIDLINPPVQHTSDQHHSINVLELSPRHGDEISGPARQLSLYVSPFLD